ncbi:type I-E CRISPR-associated protein Cas5/CasD [Streptomyces sp. NPDC092296]|uniref:type I-E CRISPR-associated protein Cas5/CasD n=1 Tax=Streptomyces sp. NPDC092296 TaxID=3366012 RepID=UPI00380CC497
MSVLTLRLAGPLQSWGSAGRFARRTTERAPTKSGVLGLLAAAQGRDRAADVSDLAALAFGIRIDQPGTRVRDFQTAHHGDSGKAMPVSERFYLADAVFVAAVEGDEALIAALHAAVRTPHYLPFLGRRSCPPSHPVDLNTHQETDLLDALRTEPWQAADWVQRRRRRERRVELEVIKELPAGEGPGDTLRDQPLSFDSGHRRYGLRSVHSYHVTVPNPHARKPPRPLFEDHDPMLGLGDA